MISDREIQGLRDEWTLATDKLERLHDRLKREGREFRPDEARQAERLIALCDELKERVELAQAEQKVVQSARNLTLPPDGTTPSGTTPPSGTDWRQARPWHNSTAPATSVRVSREPLTYERGSNVSYFMDLVDAGRGDFAAQERLHRHAREIAVEKRVDLSGTAGQGGEFEPPIWMMNEWIGVIRMGRPFADSLNFQGSPPAGASINFPKVVTGTAAAAQADLGAVQQTDATTGSLTVPINTIAGQAKVSQQLVDRSQPGIDQILFDDLVADYNLRVDLGVISGSGSGANIKGVLSDTNRITVTVTQATPAVGGAGGFYAKVADATQQIITNRGLPPSHVAMHPRRWAWVLAASDTTGRPLVEVGGQGDLQAPGIASGVNQLGDTGFTFQGLRVVVDASLPTNLGASTSEDTVLVYRAADHYLWESPPVMRAFPQPLAGNLEVLIQVYAYLAYTSRYSKATAQLAGTQLVAPTY